MIAEHLTHTAKRPTTCYLRIRDPRRANAHVILTMPADVIPSPAMRRTRWWDVDIANIRNHPTSGYTADVTVNGPADMEVT